MITANANWLAKNAECAKRLIYLFEIAGYSRTFTWTVTGEVGQQPWVTKISPLSQTVNALDGTSQLANLSFTVLDKNRLITADSPGFIFEGKALTLKVGFDGLAQGDFVTFYTGVIDSVAHSDKNNTYVFSCRDNFRRLKRVIWRTGDNGHYTSNDDPRTIVGNPMDILLDAIQTEAELSSGQINLTQIANLKATIFAGSKIKFSLTTAPECKQFIDREIFKALGGYSFIDNLGKFTPAFLIPTFPVSVAASLDPTVIVSVPEPGSAELVNAVTLRFDEGESGFGSELTDVSGTSVNALGLHGFHVIESRGLRSTFQGWGWGRLLANALFLRYGGIPTPSPVMRPLSLNLTALWDEALLEPGDFLRVTHPLIPDRTTGTLGLTNRLFEVLGRTWNFQPGTVAFELLDAKWLDDLDPWQVAGDAQAAWTAATQEQRDTYQFICSAATGQFSNSDEGQRIW